MELALHTFVCTNIKEPNPETGQVGKFCNGDKAHKLLKDYIKSLVKDSTLSHDQASKIRINKSGCLGKCGKGPIVLNYTANEELYSQNWGSYQGFDELKTLLNIELNKAFNLALAT